VLTETGHPTVRQGAEQLVMEANHERIMVMAPVGQDAPAIADLLNREGFETFICPDPCDAAREIRNADALVITEEALEFANADDLLEALKTQPPWILRRKRPAA
jgi:hypothetical protein